MNIGGSMIIAPGLPKARNPGTSFAHEPLFHMFVLY